MNEIPKIFENPLRKGNCTVAEREAARQQQIGPLTMELDWPKNYVEAR